MVEPDEKPEEEAPLLGTVRGKCITQLLLLGAIDSIQVESSYFLLMFYQYIILISRLQDVISHSPYHFEAAALLRCLLVKPVP